ncbi:hypothetical protein ACOSQ3_014306 [Xanthoceras sorbifolium]
MEFDEYDFCQAWPCPSSHPEEEEEDNESSIGPAVFSILTHVTFLHLPLDYNDSMEEDEPDFLHLVESQMEDTKFEIESHILKDQTTSRSAVEDMLTSMHISFKPFMVEEILTCASRMVTDTIYANRKVLQMEVSISLYVDELPLGVSIVMSDTTDDEEDDVDLDTSMMPTSKSSIDKLERVGIQESGELCAICLEVFLHRFEATRMPCSHLFHGGCIEQWLSKSNLCPLCRFQMS